LHIGRNPLIVFAVERVWFVKSLNKNNDKSRFLIIGSQVRALVRPPSPKHCHTAASLIFELSFLQEQSQCGTDCFTGLCIQLREQKKSGSVRRKFGRKTTGQTDGMMSFWYQAERELSQGVTSDEKSETFLE
jgi:hypothetical protein